LAESKKSEGPVEILEKLENAQQLLTLFKNKSLELCVQEARNIFDANYDHAIRDLLALFPADSKDSNGNPFWSGPKRLPVVIGFDAADPIHFGYVLNTANLIAVNLGIEPQRDQQAIAELIAKTTPVTYVKKDIKVETPEESKENEDADAQPAVAEIGDEDEAKFAKLVDDIKGLAQGLTGDEISAAEFEKDDDKNFHIDFINACSNLRARNYRIGECDRNKTKMIAGKIIPAIATATAMITGAVTTELYKFAQGMTKIESFKNAFINLALPQVQFTEPAEIKR
jgi:ubiquitin-activating enzyme E1